MSIRLSLHRTLVRSVRYWAKRYASDKQLYMLESLKTF